MRYFSSTVAPKALNGALSDSASTMTLDSLTGLPPGGYPFTLVIDPDLATEEIVLVTGTAASPANTLNIVRGTDLYNGVAGGNGTSKQAHLSGAVVKHMVTARDLQEPQTHMAATTGVHGVTGDIVGTTASQVLTGKTINSNANTLTIAQSSVTGLVSDLGAKAPSAGPTFTGTVVLPSTTSIGTVDSTELGYLDGVTSAIQTQLDGKVSEPAGAGNGFLVYTDSGDTTAVRTLVAGTGIAITNTDGQSGNPEISVTSATSEAFGTSSSGTGTGSSFTVTVSFGKTFASTPIVVATSSDSVWVPAVTARTTTGCTLTVRHINATSTSYDSVAFYWIAKV